MGLGMIDNLYLNSSGFGFLSNPLFAVGAILVVTVVLSWLLLFLFSTVFFKLASRTKTDIDDVAVAKLKSPLFYLLVIQGFRLSALHLEVNGVVFSIIDSLTAAAFVFLLARIVGVFLYGWGKVMSKRTKSRLDDVLLPLFTKISTVVFVIIGLLWVLSIWSVDITPYLAGAGIAGIVLGMAVQDSLKNVLGGISLLLDGTIKVGDKIRLDSGVCGEVLDVSLRSIKVRTYDNEVVTVPNGYLANAAVHNYTQPNLKVRVYVEFGVEYGVKIDKVKKVVLGAISGIDEILLDPEPCVSFVSMGDSALNFKAHFWVPHWKKGYGKKLEATELIYDALNKAKIGIPYPTRTVIMQKEK